MLNEYIVYWIHSNEEIDINTQGYVGITNNLSRRIKEHHVSKKDMMFGRKVDIFLFGEMQYCKQIENELRPRKKIGLNIAAGGGMPPNMAGIKKSDKTKLLMSLNNVGMKGKFHSEKTKMKMKESHKNDLGKPHTEASKKKMSDIAKQRKHQPMTGKKHSEKTRQLISAKAKMRNTRAGEIL